MSNINLNCCGCGKELGLGNRVSSDGVLWRCEDCARKQREEYDNKDQQIADLEAKLAESESELEKQKEKYDKLYECYKKTSSEDLQDKYRLAEENEKLKQQLAEKEKEIEELNDKLLRNSKWLKIADNYVGNLKRHNQDKISFAVEQLEKVKEFFLEEHRDEEMDTDYIITKDACQIAEHLLDQIKQLKEMK